MCASIRELLCEAFQKKTQTLISVELEEKNKNIKQKFQIESFLAENVVSSVDFSLIY